MNINKLTLKAQEAVVDAQTLARESGHAEFTPEHLLVALLRQEGGIVTPMLNKLGVHVTTHKTAPHADGVPASPR